MAAIGKRDARAEAGMVTSGSRLASEAGLAMLKKGGNAVDAAVATALTLGVTAPAFSGVGGGGFMLIHVAKTRRNYIIDYRESAPKRATATMYKVDANEEVIGNENSMGIKAPGVPGDFAGLALALKRFGNLSLAEVAQPAVQHAKNGYVITPLLGRIFQTNIDDALAKFRATPEAGRVMLKPNGTPYAEGERLVLRELGETIERVSKNGIAEFYEGFVADSLERHMSTNGGPLRKDDLVAYKPVMRRPIVGSYKDYKLVSMPPPSSGGIALIQLLKLFEGLDLKTKGHNSLETIDLMVKALGRVYKARELVADPDFAEVDAKKLTSSAFIKGLRSEAYGTAKAGAKRDGSQTTHLSVVDKDRNVVALTESLECFFGSGIVVPGTGVFLNDTMHDFDPVPRRINSIQPGKRPKSSMSPTIFFKDGEPVLVLGSAAGPRIITAVLQVALNVLEHGMDVQAAIAAPRFHHQGGKLIRMETRISEKVQQGLKARGYEISPEGDFNYVFGGVHAITVGDGGLHGGADPRRDGAAAGY